MARAVGVGPPFPTDVVRATMLARAAGMARGGSGVSPAVLDALVAMLNAACIRACRDRLDRRRRPAALSHLALPLIGEGERSTARARGREALARAGSRRSRSAPRTGSR
jgi:histidine ammonia-lyase